jgi:hypothetical protein
MMKKILLNILLAAIFAVSTIVLTGCTTAAGGASKATLAAHKAESSVIGGHGLGETEAERSDDHARQLRLNGSMLIDDIDAWSQTDRQSRLTEFTVR